MRAVHITRSVWLSSLLSLAVLHLVRSQDTATVTTLDDSNPAIEYSGGWSRIPGDTSYNGSSMLTRVGGSTATYKFNGIRVSVFGTQGTPGGNTTISTYSIDNSSPSQYTVPPDLKTIQLGIEFYSSPSLLEGEHTLEITNLNDQAWYWLDYIKVASPVRALPATSTSSDEASDPTLTPTPIPIPTPTADNTQQTPTPTTASTTTLISTPTAGNTQEAPIPTPTPATTPTTGNTHQQQQSKAGISKGVIAGIALGGSALIVLLFFAARWWKRRYLKPTEDDSTLDFRKPLERLTKRRNARLEPYQVDQVAASSNGLNEKHTYNDVGPIRSTENDVNASPFPVDGHTSDGATTQYTSEGRDDISEIAPSEPSTSRPMSLSKLRPPYPGAASSRNPPSTPVPQIPPSMPTPSSPPQISSSNRRSPDGIVRIAGGPPRTRGEEFEEIIDTATLPPAYGTYRDT